MKRAHFQALGWKYRAFRQRSILWHRKRCKGGRNQISLNTNKLQEQTLNYLYKAKAKNSMAPATHLAY